jgi:hypothetical protein
VVSEWYQLSLRIHVRIERIGLHRIWVRPTTMPYL